jgi:hypothetical protein
VPDSNGKPDPKKNAILGQIFTGKEFVSVVGNPGRPLLGASITADYAKNKEAKEEMLDQDDLGGPLFGRIYGNNHKNVPDLLSESNDIHLRQEQEEINGISCYVLEGTTKYGIVTAWIAADRGYAALKWVIKKTGDDIINDMQMSNTKMVLSIYQFDCQEVQEFNGYFIPTKATFTDTSKLKDGSSSSIFNVYSIGDIKLNPDFNAIGAFKINLPEGTKVTVPESPGVRHIWKGGKVVADVNKSEFDEIDKTIDKFKNQDEQK